MYYDRAGRPIEMLDWGDLFSKADYKILGQTTIGDVFVSTVWVGMDIGFMPGVLLIFETLIFTDREQWDCWTKRYATQGEAVQGHLLICSWISTVVVRELEVLPVDQPELEQ